MASYFLESEELVKRANMILIGKTNPPKIIHENTPTRLLSDCTNLSEDITKEIKNLDILNRKLYFFRFPELEKFVLDPIEYAMIIESIGYRENTDEEYVKFDVSNKRSYSILVSTSFSTTTGTKISDLA